MIFPVMCVRSGQCVAFPDVCFTPAAPSPVPMPYPNIAIPSDGDGSGKVKTMASNTLRKGDHMTKSTGDNAGSAPGGTISGMMMGAVEVKTGSNKVKAEGKEVAYHTIMTAHNGNNANAPAGGHLAPTNVKVKVIGTPGCPGSGLDALRAGGFIATGAVATGINSGDPITDAQQSLRCAPQLQQDLGNLGNQGWSMNYGAAGSTASNCQFGSNAIEIGQGYAGNPSYLTALLAHEGGHAMGGNPHAMPVTGDTQHSYATRMRDRFLHSEGQAAVRNVRATQEARQNCPGQAPPPVLGDNGTFENTTNTAANPEQQIGQQFGNLQPDGSPPGTTYNATYYNHYANLWTNQGWPPVFP